MNFINRHLGHAFLAASAYLVSFIILGFLILPGVFGVTNYNFPPALEALIAITTGLALITLLATSTMLAAPQLTKPGSKTSKSIRTTAIVIAIGFSLILLHALYVKIRTCTIDDTAAHCAVEGKSYVAMAVVVLFFATIIGILSWLKNRASTTP